jgi:hypothetical protein
MDILAAIKREESSRPARLAAPKRRKMRTFQVLIRRTFHVLTTGILALGGISGRSCRTGGAEV